ncbi:MAG: 4Fe-4S dicluster domain-containing protein [Deltaproteobacteria bacterium]
MADILGKGLGELGKEASTGKIAEVIHKLVTRRQFMRGAGAVGLGVTTFCLFGCGSSSTAANEEPRQIFVANALGMIVAEPTLCVGCRRCESACVAYNYGIVQPSIANVKVSRNQQFGVAGVTAGFQRGDGDFGNWRTVQDTCRQCPHPVGCQLACPHGAIEVIAPVNARVVNVDKCVGCGICVAACPWAMTSLSGPVNGSTTKSHKCNLCGGDPECVQACPSGALKYVDWADRTKVIPPRQVVPMGIALAVQNSCTKCH